MEIKTIQFEKQDFDESKYKIAGDFQKRFLGNHSALHLPLDAFSILSQFTDGRFEVVEFNNVDSLPADTYLEMSTFQFYALKDKTWIQNKNIIVVNMFEPWIIGIPFDDQLDYMPEIFDDPALFDSVSTAKSFTVVLDNADPRLKELYPNINWVCPNMWHFECVESLTYQGSVLANDFIKEVNMKEYIQTFAHNNKPHDFTCLIGKIKPHRLDFWLSCANQSLVEHNVIGSWDRHVINPKYESNPDHTQDRKLQPEWIEKSKVWIALESFPEQTKSGYPITQITEKTFKPIRYGMPFLISGSIHTLQTIEDLGYNSYREIFGNYIEQDYTQTNKNIINIIQNIDNYDWERIRQIALENFESLEQRNKQSYFEEIKSKICM